jgi:hypothetical protein
MTSTHPLPTRDPDAVRIVPLVRTGDVLEEEAAARPHLTYRGGPLLTAVQVVTVFWGSAWQNRQHRVSRIHAFYHAILKSSFMDRLAQYSVPGQRIRHGSRTGTAIIRTPGPGTSVHDTAIRSLLQHSIGAALPAPNRNTLFVVYLPAGTSVSVSGSQSCRDWCGYHDSINGNISYAVVPDPGCTGCLDGLKPFDALTTISSHELAEAITDPVPGTGWYDDAKGETGDICAWQTEMVAGFTVQKEWSNAESRCQ